MKSFFLIPIVLLLLSCGMSKEEQLIADYEQTIGNSKMDLKFDPQETKWIKQHTLKDSMLFYENEVEGIVKDQIKSYTSLLERAKKDIDHYSSELQTEKIQEAIVLIEEFIEGSKIDIKEYKNKLSSLQTNPYETVLPEPHLSRYKSFKSNPDSVIGDIYECRYKIFNPLMDIEQEITNQYLISPDKERILKKIE